MMMNNNYNSQFFMNMNNNNVQTAVDNKQLRTLYLGDLSYFTKESDVMNTFQVFGQIEEIRLMKSKQDGKCLGYGFITFMTVEQAHNALEAMDGKVFIGRQLNVSWAYKRNKQEIKEHKLIAQINNNHELPQGAELHFSFVSKQTDFLVTEATLRAIFEEFGPIQHICIKKTAFNERGGQNGYGFVHYPLTPEGINAAVKASSMIRQVVLDRVIYDCMMTHAFQKYLSQINSNISSPSALSLDASPSQPPLLLLSSSSHHQQQPQYHAAAQNQKMMDAFFLPSASMMQSNANPRSSMSRSSSFSSLSSSQSTSSSLWNGISEASFTSPELNYSSSVLPPGLLTSNHSSSLVFPGFSSAFY